MDVLAGAYAACCGLLAVGGAMKAAQPDPARRALRSLRLPPPRVPLPNVAVRAIGVAEVAVAAAALAAGGVLWWLVAACYAAFVVVAVGLWRGGDVESCGCFGAVESEPGLVHVVVTTVGLALALGAALDGARGPLAAALDDAGEGPLLLVSAALATVLVVLVLAELPKLTTAVRDVRGAGR